MPNSRRRRKRSWLYRYRRYTLSLIAFASILIVFSSLCYSFIIKPLREAQKNITIEIYHLDGSTKTVKIRTNEQYLRPALETEENLVAGQEQEFGLSIQTVDGITADHNAGESWVFLKNGKTVATSIDTTVIEDKDIFAFSHKKE